MDAFPHIVFTGGGTLGHLLPGLAVAEQLLRQLPQVRITFAGSGKPLERRQVAAGGFDYLPLACRPSPRRARQVFSFVVGNMSGYARARRFLAEQRVAVVVGLGGYASVPMGVAAGRRGVPLVLLEQNALPGRATRWLARWATAVCPAMTPLSPLGRNIGGEETSLRCRCPVYMTGNPIRSGFRPAASRGQQLLVLGGSGGARSLNEVVPQSLRQLGPALGKWRVLHQTGSSDLQRTRELYEQLGVPATVVDFVDDVPGVLAKTSLAVCRAGGTTLAELAAAGVPAVLLPYPHAADDHQRRNAELFDAAGGTLSLDECVLPGRLGYRLATALATLLSSSSRRAAMSAAIQRLARPNAAAEVATLVAAMLPAEQYRAAARRAA